MSLTCTACLFQQRDRSNHSRFKPDLCSFLYNGMYLSFTNIHFWLASSEVRRHMSSFCQHCHAQLDWHPCTKVCNILSCLDWATQSIEKLHEKNFCTTQATSKPKISHSLVFRQALGTAQREAKEVKDRRYKLKEGNSILKSCGNSKYLVCTDD